MFPNSLNKVEHMAAIEKTLDNNPVTPKHTKILCSRLVELIHCSFQTSVDVDINFGDVNGTNTKHEKTVTIVNDTEQIFLFTIAKFQLGEAKEEALSKFYIETENEERNFTLLAGGSHDVKLKFYCKLLNCYHYDYYELSFQILDDFSWSDNIEEQESSEVKSFVNNRNRSKKTKVTWSKNSTPKTSDKTIKHNLINKLEEIKLNIVPLKVCEKRNKMIEHIKKAIKLNLSGVCMSPKVYANKQMIKLQSSQKKSLKIFNDSMKKSAYIQINTDDSNCPIQFNCSCEILKPMSSISLTISLKLDRFVSEYYYKRVYISVLDHEPLMVDIYACYHIKYNIEHIDSMDHFHDFLKVRAAEDNVNDEAETSDTNFSFLKTFEDVQELHDSQNLVECVSVLENFFHLDAEQYFTSIQPNILNLNKYANKKQFVVKNKLNIDLFVIWNKDISNRFTIDPMSAFIDEHSYAVFNVEYTPDVQERFQVSKLDCTVYYGDQRINIELNQGKYEKRYQRLNYFLPYSSYIKLCAHSFSNGHSWIPKYSINQEQLIFQFLLNNNKQTSMAYSSILIKNCGFLPLLYSIDEIKGKYYDFETHPKCNYIQYKKNQENFHIIYAFLKVKKSLPVSWVKQNFTICLNTDAIYNEKKSFAIYSDDDVQLSLPKCLMDERNIIPEQCEPVLEEQEIFVENQHTTPRSSLPPKVDVNKISLYKTVASKSLFANKVASVFENQMRNIESNIKPPCWDNDITDYNVVTFPHIHPGCCISVNIPLYNPSQHTILYEFELINNVDSWPYSENVFSLDRTNGPLFSNQFVEIRCTFHPRQCQEYSQFLKCKPTCFLSDVQMPEMFFLLRGNSVECEILCEPEHMDLGQVQSQFHIEGFFQIQNIQTSRVNFLLRCTIESDGQKIDEYNLDKMDSQYSTSLDTNGTYESNNNTIKSCQKKNKIILVNSESIRNYEDLVRKLDLVKDNTDLHKSNVAAISIPKEESTNNIEKSETSNELTKIKYVDGLAASSSFKRLGSLRNDFIILYPTIDVLGPNEYKIIEFVYHPFTSGQCRLNIQLFTLENELDITSELKYDETRCIDLLSIQYNCFDSYVEIVDVNLSKNGGSKCYSSYDYYFDFLKIPSLNEKLKPKEITRLDHTFNLPNFEAGKDVTFELLLRNITSASNFHMININHGICSGCYAKQQYPNNEHSNVRLCKHFEKYVHIEPNLVTFEDETSRGVTFSINYGTEEFSHFIRRTTGCNVTEYHTTFCIYVNNSCHSMCVVQKYIHLVIRFSTITRNKAECDRFLLPMDVSVRHQHESYVGKMLGDDGNTSDMSAASLKDPRVDFGQRKAMDSITVKFFNYKLDRTNDAQPFWLYNNTSQNVEVSVKVIDKYRKSVQIISENFVVKNNSKYPILFLLNASGTLESFAFEIMDNVTHVVRNITVTIQDVRECPASELSKSKANLSFSSPFILSRNPLIIQPIPLHHTTTRKITLKNPYHENVVFNWDSIQIDGVLKLDVKPKFGLLKPNKCKQMSLMIHALSFPAKLKFVVLSVKFYKEKYFIEYFDTLKELCETERKRSDIYHSGSGGGVTYRELNIEEYRIYACPKPNIQTIGLQIHTYDVLEFPHQTEHQESPPDSLVYTKINPKLHKQYRKQYRSSCTVKLNKILQSDIKNIFQTMFWYLIQKSKEITEVPNDTYEAMSRTSHNDCTHAISIAEDICASLFEKILYRNVCKFKDFQDDLSICDEQQETSYASIKSYVVHAIEEELAKGDQTLDDSDEDSDDESDQDGLVDEDNARIRKNNAFGMINDYFYDILKG